MASVKRSLKFLFVCSVLIALSSCKKTVTKIIYQEPVVNAGLSQDITLPTSSVTLTGIASDADGSITGYLWSQVSGPSNATIANNTSASTSVTGLVAGSYIFKLAATDNMGAVGVDTLIVKVNPGPITFTAQPANNPDERMIVSINGVDQSFTGSTEWIIDAWTRNSQPYIGRMAVKFDLNIPTSATIVSANLYLYSNNPPENGNLVNANFGTDNSLILRRITAPWVPANTTWSAQPVTSTSDQIIVPHTALSELDLNIDVKDMVSTMISSGNYGFLLRLQNEVQYTSRQFVSSYHATKTTKRPKLVVVYK